MTPLARPARVLAARLRRRGEGGYVAILTGLLMVVFVGLAAIAVDLGRSYVVGQQGQRAADAAALAGVVSLPGDQATARATAVRYSTLNGFTDGTDPESGDVTSVVVGIDGRPTRLRVTVTRTVHTFFASVLGQPTQTVTRTAVADYAGPVPMGSPCNEYGDDPDPADHRSATCNGTGEFWANVGSPLAPKGNGDAYQNDMASNTDFDPNGYFYSVTVRKPVSSLTIQAFDPAFVDVGDACTVNNLAGAKGLDCVQDRRHGPVDAVCRQGGQPVLHRRRALRRDRPGHHAVHRPLAQRLTPGTRCRSRRSERRAPRPSTGYSAVTCPRPWTRATPAFNAEVAQNFRQWVTLCTIPNAVPGTYMIQVKTNGVGNDLASGHNRFSLRAYGSSSADNDAISVAGYNKMAMYANTPNGTSKFYLARVPSGARGQLFNVRLYDIGDGAKSGSTITVLPPVEVTGTLHGLSRRRSQTERSATARSASAAATTPSGRPSASPSRRTTPAPTPHPQDAGCGWSSTTAPGPARPTPPLGRPASRGTRSGSWSDRAGRHAIRTAVPAGTPSRPGALCMRRCDTVGSRTATTVWRTWVKGRVLVVDDDLALAEMLGIVLHNEGLDVVHCADGSSALAVFRESRPDVVLLDVMLPGIDGIEVCRRIRAESGIPIVMLTARTDTIDVVVGLESGADDYVSKPFKPQELIARVRARLRRTDEPEPEALEIGDLTIDVAGHSVKREGRQLSLTPLEFDLLVALARKPWQVFSREVLLEQVWGYRHAGDTRLVNVHVQRLRSKIEHDPEHPQIVVTVRGVGYKAGPA